MWESAAYAGEEWCSGWGIKRFEVVGLILGFVSIAGVSVEVDVVRGDGDGGAVDFCSDVADGWGWILHHDEVLAVDAECVGADGDFW